MKMRSREWAILSILALAVSAGLLIAVLLTGACSGSIETAAGSQVPMKCHWTFKAVCLSAWIPIILSLLQVFLKGKSGRRVSAAVLFVSALILFLLTTEVGIGICEAEGMACGRLALAVRLGTIVLAVLAVVQFARAEDKTKGPKRRF